MEYRKLGNTELELSAIAYGAFAIGGTMWGGNEKKDSIEAIHASLDHGVTTLDTAPFYGFGLSEEIIGEALKGKDRTKVQILTKFGLVWDKSNQDKGEHFFDIEDNGINIKIYKYSSKANIIKEVEESLKRLNTDYIDLLQQHWPEATTHICETMEAMEILIQQGKIRAAGVCNYNLNQLKEASKTLIPASNQLYYSMLNRSIENEMLPYTIENNIGVIAYSPMERGLLSGKYFQNEKLQVDDHGNDYFGQFDLDKVKTFLEAITPITKDKNVSLSQLVLRWTSLQPGISTVLAGARNADQAIANAQALNINLTADEIQMINYHLSKI
ncbi:aldo/keto reductase [Pedobacter nutrimenti]|uniref:aldo/keto reductase n=1 Tax=Pedobacter nutrimenti TaxID=1241337 RepID=UPI0029301B7C|nr:aldo/keto reductase [Pedobacter nutrimenti]